MKIKLSFSPDLLSLLKLNFSPDLNPIENIWGYIKAYLRRINCQRRAVLIQEIQEAWDNIVTPELCAKLAASMPKRIREVETRNGGFCKY